MLSLRTVAIITMLVFMLAQSLVFGSSDILSLLMVIIASAIIFNTTLKLQIGNKKALRANAKKNSWLYLLLSDEKSIVIKLFSLASSLIIAILLVMTLKGIVLNHGVISLFILIGIVSFTIFSFLNENDAKSSFVDDNIQTDIARHANDLMHVVIVAVLLNLVLSMLLSAHDTISLLNNDITFNNFDQHAYDDRIEKNGNNHYTRIMINIFIVLDYLKLAVTTTVIDIFMPGKQDKEDLFYIFYIVVLLLNFMKLFAFSLSFVLMQKGMETSMKKIRILINKVYSESKDKKQDVIEITIEDK